MKRYSWPADHSDPVNSARKATESLNLFYIETNMPIMAKTTHRPPGKKGAKKKRGQILREEKPRQSDYCLT